MGKLQRELDRVRRDIQREKATLRALQRQYKRMNGEEVIHSSSTADAERLDFEIGGTPDQVSMEAIIQIQRQRIKDLQDEAQRLKEEMISRFPLTPCALYKLLTYDKGVKRRKRKRRRKQPRQL